MRAISAVYPNIKYFSDCCIRVMVLLEDLILFDNVAGLGPLNKMGLDLLSSLCLGDTEYLLKNASLQLVIPVTL